MSVNTISPKQLHDRWQAGESIDLIDVWTPAELREIHWGSVLSIAIHP